MLAEKLDHIVGVLQENGYPDNMDNIVEKVGQYLGKQRTHIDGTKDPESISTAVIPYVSTVVRG